MRTRVVGLLLACVAAVVAVVYFSQTEGHLRGEPLKELLQPVAEGKDADKASVAKALLANYTETRQIAALWSGLYWGFAWTAAVLGALSGLILKLESFIREEKVKKDIAAVFAVSAAIMITVSTGGDFQRKWQANRAAAAAIEQLGYDFLSKDGESPRPYFSRLGEVLVQRHMSILGTPDKRSANPAPSASQPK
jgi:hypothetical protein